MGTTQSFQPPPFDPAELTADSAGSGGSFWTGAPKLLAAFATLLGSIVALTTVLVQAGVIGASRTAAETVPSPPAQKGPAKTDTARKVPAQTVPSVPVQPLRAVPGRTAEPPSLDQALGDLNGLLTGSAHTKGNLGKLVADVQAEPPAIDRDVAVRHIGEIIRQRRQLHAELAAFSAPAPLSKALALLRDSITASLADDRLVRQWIVARYEGDASEDALWQAQLEASLAAGEAKRTFKTEYADRLVASGVSFAIPDY
jgi:hypothetical protein